MEIFDLKLKDIKEIQPFPMERYILIKSKKKDYKVLINENENFPNAVSYIKNILGFYKPLDLEKKLEKQKKIYLSKCSNRGSRFKYNNKIYTRKDLYELGLNPISINNAINGNRLYKGQKWERVININGKWVLDKREERRKEHQILCLESNEIKTYKEWANILGVKSNTITKNVSKNYKTKGLTLIRVD